MKRAFLLFSIPLIFSLLSYQDPTTQEEAVCRGRSVPVLRLDYGGIKRQGQRISFSNGGPLERARLVFRDREEFAKFWQEMTRMTINDAPLPEVDFSREMLIVAAMGEKSSPAYRIIVDDACEVNNQLEVPVSSIDNSRCGAALGVVVSPVDIVKLPRTDLPVVFRELETSDCQKFLRPKQ